MKKAILLILLLAGCAVAPDKAPHQNMAQDYASYLTLELQTNKMSNPQADALMRRKVTEIGEYLKATNQADSLTPLVFLGGPLPAYTPYPKPLSCAPLKDEIRSILICY